MKLEDQAFAEIEDKGMIALKVPHEDLRIIHEFDYGLILRSSNN